MIQALFQVGKGRIEVEAVPLDVQGHEKGNALDVVPVGVRQHDSGDPLAPTEIALHQLGPEGLESAPAIEDDEVPGRGI